jgi:hypothetical protein
MEFINKELQDYFIKMAPDFSVFEMIERYYYDNNDSFGDLADIMYYNGETLTPKTAQTHINRGMFLVYLDGSWDNGAQVDTGATLPTIGSNGDIFFNTTDGKLYTYTTERDIWESMTNNIGLLEDRPETPKNEELYFATDTSRLYTDGNLTIEGLAKNEYTVFPYGIRKRIIIAVSELPIKILSDTDMEMIVGVAF